MPLSPTILMVRNTNTELTGYAHIQQAAFCGCVLFIPLNKRCYYWSITSFSMIQILRRDLTQIGLNHFDLHKKNILDSTGESQLDTRLCIWLTNSQISGSKRF